MQASDWLDRFPLLQTMGAETTQALALDLTRMAMPEGFSAFSSGARCDHYLFITEGRVRVQMTMQSGREVVLYRVRPGETCLITTACLFGECDYIADAVTKAPTVGYGLAFGPFKRWISQSSIFRDFVFQDYSRRMLEIVGRLDDIVTGSIDSRLATFMLHNCDREGQIKRTHQEIAAEIGSAREVVTRHLKNLQRNGAVELHRGLVAVRDWQKLHAMSRSNEH